MGNCGSVRKTQESSPKSKLKCSSFSRTGCILTERPIQENTIRTVMPGASSFRELINGKEDMQFSPDPWLESDCEDFFSVNGDLLTPSSTNTPIHQSSPIKSAATDVKKQLIELFHESFNGEAGHQDLHYESEAESSIFHLPQNSANKTPYESVADIVFRSVAISNANSEPRTRKDTQFAQCCLPKLVRSLSFSERKKR